MLDVVEHAQEEHDIEAADAIRRELVDVGKDKLNLRPERLARREECLALYDIGGNHFGAPALHLKAEPPIPAADVQHALAAQIVRDGEPFQARAQMGDALPAFDDAAVRQLKAVIPSLASEFLDEIGDAPRSLLVVHTDMVFVFEQAEVVQLPELLSPRVKVTEQERPSTRFPSPESPENFASMWYPYSVPAGRCPTAASAAPTRPSA